ncbi:hypothetical protein ACJ41O_003225 [Fusarium nematophilum]
MDSNPEVIQPEDWRSRLTPGSSVPVFLIHDGGGTTFAYHCLNNLSRPMYGIHNPNFRTGEKFDGGIPDMARLYCGFIKQAVKEVGFPKRRNADGKARIILGGWSLGGLLSLEMAKQLGSDDTSGVEVIGILMVDSLYPIKALPSDKVAPAETSEEGKTKNQVLSQRAMNDARRMIREWDVPVWEGDSAGQRPLTYLLRAKKAVPQSGDGTSLVDLTRQERNLGWDAYDKDMFSEVVDVEGHHFDMFSFENIEGISVAMKQALIGLELAVIHRS